MSTVRGNTTGGIPPEQQAIRDKCYHPTGTFIEFKEEEIEQSIPQRFEEQVRKYPDRLAVKDKSRQLTYSELNKAANRVARAILTKSGNRPEPVAILWEQGTSTVIAALAALKAAKTPMGINPALPPSGIANSLKDSQAGLLITNKNLPLDSQFNPSGIPLLYIDELDSEFCDENLDQVISPDAIAYLRYTSGSTGNPKMGVRSHRNLLHKIMTFTNNFHICAEDRLTSLNQSPLVDGFLNALLNGAAIFPKDIKTEGLSHVGDWLVREELTIYDSVATTFRHFIDTLDGRERFPNLRIVRLGGEPVYRRDLELFQKHFSSKCVFINLIGATETDGVFSMYFADQNTRLTSSHVPIGYAVEGKEVLLLDEVGQRVGIGTIGEITVKSQYFTPMYWRNPELTAAAFQPDPEGGETYIYRTGDLGLMRPDGCLIHMGRKDSQVKIRGNRVETAEVAMALLELDIVKEAVVIARENASGNEFLVAYTVPATEQTRTGVSELRRALTEKLPAYMIPAKFVLLDTFPLTSTGKIDHLALPVPSTARPELGTPFGAPLTPVEVRLANVWAEVLGLDRVGIYDEFLELGGDSLLASQVVSRVIKTFQVDLPLRSLFEAPTVAEMAIVIVQGQVESADPVGLERFLQELESLPEASL